MTGSDRTALHHLVEEGNEEATDRLALLAAQDGEVETVKDLVATALHLTPTGERKSQRSAVMPLALRSGAYARLGT